MPQNFSSDVKDFVSVKANPWRQKGDATKLKTSFSINSVYLWLVSVGLPTSSLPRWGWLPQSLIWQVSYLSCETLTSPSLNLLLLQTLELALLAFFSRADQLCTCKTVNPTREVLILTKSLSCMQPTPDWRSYQSG